MDLSGLGNPGPPGNKALRTVQEREILRVSGSFVGASETDASEQARDIVLHWAQQRSGGSLPTGAWEGAGFEFMLGGRTTLASRVTGDEDIWALRCNDPDKETAGRVWTTEVTIGRSRGEPARFSLRLLASIVEARLGIEPAVPTIVKQLAEHCGLHVGALTLAPIVLATRSSLLLPPTPAPRNASAIRTDHHRRTASPTPTLRGRHGIAGRGGSHGLTW